MLHYSANLSSAAILDVSRIIPVRWNAEAFDSLVVDDATKELISALVTNQIDAEKSTDLMSGKGNGLFILLHGYELYTQLTWTATDFRLVGLELAKP